MGYARVNGIFHRQFATELSRDQLQILCPATYRIYDHATIETRQLAVMRFGQSEKIYIRQGADAQQAACIAVLILQHHLARIRDRE